MPKGSRPAYAQYTTRHGAKPKWMGTTSKVTKVVKKYVNKRIKNEQEKHFIDVTTEFFATGAQTNSTGIITPLSLIAQGDDPLLRNGDKIKPQMLRLKFEVQPNVQSVGNLTPFETYFRTMVFQDTLCNGSVASISDLLQTVAYDSDINDVAIISKRFRVLFDKIWQIDPLYNGSQVATQSVPPFYTSDTFQRLSKNRKMSGSIDYIASTAAIGAQGRHGVFLLTLSNQASVQSPYMRLQSRIVFID